MSILKNIFCHEKIRVTPVEIKENDYLTAVENNTKEKYGDKFSQYGYIYKKSIVIYKVLRFAEQDSQTQMTALLFEVLFFAHTIYPPQNVSIKCEIQKKKISSDKTTAFILKPVVQLNEISRKCYDKDLILVQVAVETKDIKDQEKYKIGNKIMASIHSYIPWLTKGEYTYACLGRMQDIQTDVYLYKKIENHELRYIEKKNKLLGQKKNQKNNLGNIEETSRQLSQNQEQNIEIDLDVVDSDSDQSETNNRKNKEDKKKTMDQQQKKTQKARIYLSNQDQDQESEDNYDTEKEDEEYEEEEEEEEEEDQEGGGEEDQSEYEADEEDEDEDNDEKEEVEEEIEEIEE